MTCNHAKINDSDWSDPTLQTLTLPTQDLNFFSTPAFRRVSTLADAHKCEKRVHNLTLDATQRNAGTSVILLTDLRQTGRQSSPDTYSVPGYGPQKYQSYTVSTDQARTLRN